MDRLAKDKGVTLMALVITIVILLILSTLTLTSGRETIESARLTAFSNEMQIVQRKVNELEEKYRKGDESVLHIGYPLQETEEETNAFEGADEGETDAYRFYAKDTLQELGLGNLSYQYLVDVKRRSVIALKGANYRGLTYYTLEQVPSSLYNVEHSKIESRPTFDLDAEYGTIKINNIDYNGNVNKGTIYYGKRGDSGTDWKILKRNTTDETARIEVTENGTWAVKIVDSADNTSQEKTVEVRIYRADATIGENPNNVLVITGSPATFKVDAEGYNLTYQWYKNTVDSNTSGTKIEGATDKNYTIETTTKDMNGTYYYCVVTSNGISNEDVETKTSIPAKLTVVDRITSAGLSATELTIPEGGTIGITVEVAESEEVTYQWYKNDTDSNTGGTPVEGATGNKLEKANAVEDDSGYYYCVVTQHIGSNTNEVTTETAHVTVQKERVFAKLYDNDNDGEGDTLVLSKTKDITYTKGTLVTDYDEVPRNITSANQVPWYRNDRTKILTTEIIDTIRPLTTKYWFYYCSNMTSIDGIENLDTSNVTNMDYMFNICSGLTSLDVSNFNTAAVTSMKGMFGGCVGLTNLDVSNFNTAAVTNMYSMFNSCRGLTSLDVSSFDTTVVTDMQEMFYGCRGLTSLDVSNFNTAAVTNMYIMFGACSELTSLDVSSFNTSAVTNMCGMFSKCSGLTNLDLSSFDTTAVTNMGAMFYKCSELTRLDMSSFNTAAVTDMGDMFSECSGLTSLDVSNFNTAAVTSMKGMFGGCVGLTNLDVSNFNTASVTNMVGMFSECSGLTSLDVSRFNTASVTDMGSMFSECSGLTSLDLSRFDTASVTYMGDMFSECSGLTSLDLSSFNTASVTNMMYMYRECSGLTSIDVSGFDTSKVTVMFQMFIKCNKLTTIYASENFVTTAVTNSTDMFTGSTKIVGGAGTVYDSNHVDHTYAHIDGGTSNPGYFTLKTD